MERAASLNPDVAGFLDGAARNFAFPSAARSDPDVRAKYLAGQRTAPPSSPDGEMPVGRVFERPLPSGARVRVTVPDDDGPFPVLAYFHGGGWVGGGLYSNDRLCRILTNELRCVVINVDYRLAPEHPYPAALDDCWEAMEWAVEHPEELSGDGGPIAVAGSSAGGNLAAAVALGARDRGWDHLALQVLVYPVLDSAMDTPSYETYAEGVLLEHDQMAWYWQQYVPDPEGRTTPYASPAHATELGGLAPAVVLTAENDPLRDEAEQFARRLEAAGVPVRLRRVPGQIHGFMSFLGLLPSAESAVEELLTAVRALWPGTAGSPS